jgi:hypothetical protein
VEHDHGYFTWKGNYGLSDSEASEISLSGGMDVYDRELQLLMR